MNSFFINIWICTSVHVEKQSVNDIETPRIYRRMNKTLVKSVCPFIFHDGDA